MRVVDTRPVSIVAILYGHDLGELILRNSKLRRVVVDD